MVVTFEFDRWWSASGGQPHMKFDYPNNRMFDSSGRLRLAVAG